MMSLATFLSGLPRSDAVVNGEAYLRFECSLGPDFAPCPQHFKGPAGWQSPGELATLYHATTLAAMDGPSRWAPRSRGIRQDDGMVTSLNGHSGRYGVFGHGTAQVAHMCRDPQDWRSCFLELRCNYVFVVPSGMRARYVAPGAPGEVNRHCRVAAIWLLQDAARLVLCQPPAQPPVEPKEEPAAEPAAWNAAGSCAVVWSYAGTEHTAEGRQELGYLAVTEGETVEVLSQPHPGHAGNLFAAYVFASGKAGRGWLPTLLLGPAGPRHAVRRWALVHGLRSPRGSELNGRIFEVTAERSDGRWLLTEGDEAIAVRPAQYHLFFTAEAVDLPGRHKKLLLRGHPDKGGDRSIFDLAMLL